MKHAAILPVLLILASCHCPESTEPEPTTSTDECACDCPDGPPPEGQISTFRLIPEHDGEACCLGPSVVGKCVGAECVVAQGL